MNREKYNSIMESVNDYWNMVIRPLGDTSYTAYKNAKRDVIERSGINYYVFTAFELKTFGIMN